MEYGLNKGVRYTTLETSKSATNETGFTELPAGMRSAGYAGIYESCNYDETGTGSNLFSFSHNGTGRNNLVGSKPIAGISVRRVKD